MKWRQLLTIYVLPCLLLLFSAPVLAQTKTVTGKVTDTTGAPIVGASVMVKGSRNGVVTDASGGFSLTAPASAKAIVITSVGFRPQEVSLDGGSTGLLLRLRGGTAELNEVVVIGYGTVQKKDLTGAVSSVNAKDFQSGAITSPDQLIAGKIAGVSVTPNGGQPGGATVIRIRGLSSLNSNNDPLYVLDGAILPPVGQGIAGVASPLDMLDPDDIANITVLKDAASAAIYGSRASAGVIIITTKKGRAGKPVFNANVAFSVGTIAKKESVLNAAQFRNLVKSTPADSPGIKLLGPANTDWQKQIYQVSRDINANISVSGTTKHLPYRVSVGVNDQTGILKTDKLQRATGAIHLTPHLLDDHLKIELNLNGGLTQSRFANQSAIGSAVAFDPTQPVYSTDKGKFGGYYEWMNVSGFPLSLATRNPVALLQQNRAIGYAENSIGNLNLDYELPWIHGLHVIYNIGYDVSEGHGSTYVPAYAAQQYYNSTALGSDSSASGENSKYKTTTVNVFNEISLKYVKDLKSIKSNIEVLGTYGYYHNKTTAYSYPTYGSDKYSDSLRGGSTPTYPIAPGESYLISYLGRIRYTYDNKYTLQATVRDDGSSKFAPAYRWGTFPTVSASWRIGQEKFLQNTRWMNELKIRASYGVTGNQDGIGDYGYIPSYYLSNNNSLYPFGDTYYYMQTPQPYINNLQWEQTASENVGIDFGFANNRISGSIDYYYKTISHLFNQVPIPGGTNFTNEDIINIGNMTDRGIEVNLNLIPIRNALLEWDVNLNFAYNKNLITKLVNNSKDSTFFGDVTGGIAGATGQNIQVQTVGQTPFSFFPYQQIYGKNGLPLEGVYVDQNRDGMITQGYDQVHWHSPFAPVTMGFSTSVTYKKWSVSLVARGNFGNYVYNNVDADNGVTKYVYNALNFLGNVASDYNKTGFYNSQFQSSYYIQNASFVKIDNLGVGYNVGKLSHSTSLRLSANCQNVLVITKYTGLDPEVYGGIDNNIYPRPRTFTVGANLNF
jgi:TonB-dependent starch-binding outer membrane protein SusC